MKVTREFVRDGKTVVVTAQRIEGDRWRVRVGDTTYEFAAVPLGDGGVRVDPIGDGAGEVFTAYGAATPNGFMVRADGSTHTLAAPAGRRGGGGGSDGTVRAPMTGTVLDVRCAPGDAVEADQTLVVVSAMKMEHKLTAGIAGVVRLVQVQTGAIVDQGEELIVVEPDEAKP